MEVTWMRAVVNALSFIPAKKHPHLNVQTANFLHFINDFTSPGRVYFNLPPMEKYFKMLELVKEVERKDGLRSLPNDTPAPSGSSRPSGDANQSSSNAPATAPIGARGGNRSTQGRGGDIRQGGESYSPDITDICGACHLPIYQEDSQGRRCLRNFHPNYQCLMRM